MATSNREAVTLEDEDLNDWDRRILDYLKEGRATPGLVRKYLVRDGESITRQYINGRMKRLEEHEHLENLLDSGVYELVDDPRNGEEVADGGPVEGQARTCPDCGREFHDINALLDHVRSTDPDH